LARRPEEHSLHPQAEGGVDVLGKVVDESSLSRFGTSSLEGQVEDRCLRFDQAHFSRENQRVESVGDAPADFAGRRELFAEASGRTVPVAASEEEEQIRELILDVTRVNEAWLSQRLRLQDFTDFLKEGSTLSPEAQQAVFDAYKEADARQTEANDLLRRLNPLLEESCGLSPLETHPT